MAAMDIYALNVEFKALPSFTLPTSELGLPSSLGRDVVANVGKRSVRVRRANSPADAIKMAQDLQASFSGRELPADVERRLKKALS